MRGSFRSVKRRHDSKKLNKREEEKWRPIIFDRDGNEIEEREHFSPSRYRLIAVKALGYTHTEAGYLSIGRIIDEAEEYNDMLVCSRNKDGDDIYD